MFKVTSEDKINHPSHYGGEDNPYEVIKVLEAWLSYEEFIGALKFNIHKYLARAGRKNPEAYLEDLKKAQWYMKYMIDYMACKKQPEEAHKHDFIENAAGIYLCSCGAGPGDVYEIIDHGEK